MDNVTSTRTNEKNTSPSLPTFISQHDDDDMLPLASDSESQPQQRGRRNPNRRPWLTFVRGYGTTLIIGLPVLPIIVSAVTIVIYLSGLFNTGWATVVSGVVVTYVGWSLISLLLIPLTSPRNANSRSYGLLESRLRQLETRLFTFRNEHPDEKGLPEYQQIALNEAYDKLQEITEDLYESGRRLPWPTGFGYVNMWGMLHRAEEALVEVEPKEMVMRGAMHDKMAISGSQMSNRDELLAKLRFAARKLDPSMIGLFKPLAVPAPPEESESQDIQQLEKDVAQIAEHLGVKLHREHTASSVDDSAKSAHGAKSAHDGGDEARARLTLREVRRSLNDYRDHLWEGLVRARNNLLGVTFVTGLGTHILLCIAILALPVNSASRATIIAAVSYYMLGAIAGLFGRIGQATLSNVAVDDYGLTLAQVMSRPLYSGLAGLGGVLLSSTVLGISTTNTVQTVFSSLRLDYLIVAAAFGLTPNLIAGGLQNQSNKLLSALRASKTTVSDKSASNDDGQSAGN